MSHEHAPEYPRQTPSMEKSLGREGRERIIRQALERIDGAPAPTVDMMQAAMGTESRIRLVHDVVRAYLDEHRFTDTKDWAQSLRERSSRSDQKAEAV
ncbi:hypothetical protein [Microbacterium sp. NPDC090014]|uniref:hypothetical protein n=1 Tax=Microbacterium sp. NPDC090014 TaxID=3364205 RepID=UPI0025DEABCD|nr:hypothetical protein [uncultured Microbacterium sp.]